MEYGMKTGGQKGVAYCALEFGLYKIFVQSNAILHYSIVLVSPPRSALLTLL